MSSAESGFVSDPTLSPHEFQDLNDPELRRASGSEEVYLVEESPEPMPPGRRQIRRRLRDRPQRPFILSDSPPVANVRPMRARPRGVAVRRRLFSSDGEVVEEVLEEMEEPAALFDPNDTLLSRESGLSGSSGMSPDIVVEHYPSDDSTLTLEPSSPGQELSSVSTSEEEEEIYEEAMEYLSSPELYREVWGNRPSPPSPLRIMGRPMRPMIADGSYQGNVLRRPRMIAGGSPQPGPSRRISTPGSSSSSNSSQSTVISRRSSRGSTLSTPEMIRAGSGMDSFFSSVHELSGSQASSSRRALRSREGDSLFDLLNIQYPKPVVEQIPESSRPGSPARDSALALMFGEDPGAIATSGGPQGPGTALMVAGRGSGGGSDPSSGSSFSDFDRSSRSRSMHSHGSGSFRPPLAASTPIKRSLRVSQRQEAVQGSIYSTPQGTFVLSQPQEATHDSIYSTPQGIFMVSSSQLVAQEGVLIPAPQMNATVRRSSPQAQMNASVRRSPPQGAVLVAAPQMNASVRRTSPQGAVLIAAPQMNATVRRSPPQAQMNASVRRSPPQAAVVIPAAAPYYLFGTPSSPTRRMQEVMKKIDEDEEYPKRWVLENFGKVEAYHKMKRKLVQFTIQFMDPEGMENLPEYDSSDDLILGILEKYFWDLKHTYQINVMLSNIPGATVAENIENHRKKILSVLEEYECKLFRAEDDVAQCKAQIAHLDAELTAALMRIEQLEYLVKIDPLDRTVAEFQFMEDLRNISSNRLHSSLTEEVMYERHRNRDLEMHIDSIEAARIDAEEQCIMDMAIANEEANINATIEAIIRATIDPQKIPNTTDCETVVRHWCEQMRQVTDSQRLEVENAKNGLREANRILKGLQEQKEAAQGKIEFTRKFVQGCERDYENCIKHLDILAEKDTLNREKLAPLMERNRGVKRRLEQLEVEHGDMMRKIEDYEQGRPAGKTSDEYQIFMNSRVRKADKKAEDLQSQVDSLILDRIASEGPKITDIQLMMEEAIKSVLSQQAGPTLEACREVVRKWQEMMRQAIEEQSLGLRDIRRKVDEMEEQKKRARDMFDELKSSVKEAEVLIEQRFETHEALAMEEGRLNKQIEAMTKRVEVLKRDIAPLSAEMHRHTNQYRRLKDRVSLARKTHYSMSPYLGPSRRDLIGPGYTDEYGEEGRPGPSHAYRTTVRSPPRRTMVLPGLAMPDPLPPAAADATFDAATERHDGTFTLPPP